MSTTDDYHLYQRALHGVRDFKRCKEFLSLLDPKSDSPEWEAAEIAFIVTYARNFVGGNEKIDRSIPSCLPAEVLQTLPAPAMQLHEKIVKAWRNKLVAHTELGHIKPRMNLAGSQGVGRQAEFDALQPETYVEEADVSPLWDLVSAVEKETAKLLLRLHRALPEGSYVVSTDA
jgi:hypothetical protein